MLLAPSKKSMPPVVLGGSAYAGCYSKSGFTTFARFNFGTFVLSFAYFFLFGSIRNLHL